MSALVLLLIIFASLLLSLLLSARVRDFSRAFFCVILPYPFKFEIERDRQEIPLSKMFQESWLMFQASSRIGIPYDLSESLSITDSPGCTLSDPFFLRKGCLRYTA